MNLTHRQRLVFTASAVSGLVLAVLFIVARSLYRGIEVAEEYGRLSPIVSQTLSGAKNGRVGESIGIVRSADPMVSLVVFKDGRPIVQGGPVDLTSVRRNGQATLDGQTVTAFTARGGGYLVVASRPWSHRETNLRRLTGLLAAMWLPLVGLIAGATALASRATFRPLDELRRQADAAREGGLHGRLQVDGQDEYGEFAQSLNAFLDNLEKLVRNEEQFVADAAHELRTPLTALRGRLETTLLRERSGDEYRAALGQVLSEAERLSSLVEALLGSATAAAARPTKPLSLDAEVERAHARWIDRYVEADVVLEARAHPVRAAVTPTEIDSILDNLLANALRASPRGTTCALELTVAGDEALIVVQDAGPGVPEEMRERIFDRFVRGEEGGRNRATGGFGIGLSLCRRIVTGRGGTIRVAPSDQGARFEVRLPKV